MTTATSILSPPGLRSRLRDIGIVLCATDAKGEILARNESNNDWLADLLLHSPIVHGAVSRSVQGFANGTVDNAPCLEILSGLWACPLPIKVRRKTVGYLIALIPTQNLLAAEQLSAFCASARMDFQLAQSFLTQLPLIPETEVPRMVAIVRSYHSDLNKTAADTTALESISRQLAESYEEMNLLYTLTQSMTVQQRPDRFVAKTCQELLATLTYAWIGAQFVHDDTDRFRSLSDRLIVAGKQPLGNQELSLFTRRLLQSATANGPTVIEPLKNSDFADCAVLGQTLLVHPVTVAGRLIGVLIAGDKRGPDLAASNTDMKLLGAAATHTAIFLENAALYDDLNSMFIGTLYALTASIDAKDRYTCGHSRRVAHLTRQLAEAIGLDEYTVERMHIAGLVHDVGKIGVPESVLLKPGRLNEQEFQWIRQHPEMGHRILKDIPQLRDILPGVLHHHESWNGKGYPAGLKGEQIPLVARLICLADAFDAMSSTRTYRSAMSRPDVLAEIRRCSGVQFDPALVPVFIALNFDAYDQMVIDHRAADTSPDLQEKAA
ncbi:MAG TPA: HD domain-containing phosphohydrolase [Phycisphaerales bacterium]|nr:HD domain-containing phosphohydrolase [Phycisphaerales bacterium]